MAINSGNSTSTNMPTSNVLSNGHSLPDTNATGDGAPIAIIGMSCRFAGDVTSPSKLWDLCTGSGDAWTPIPHERFDAAGLYDKRKAKRGRVCACSPCQNTANAMDPQIRMLLESVYESMEDAGIPIQKLAGSNTSVFAGSFSTDYSDMTLKDPYIMHETYKTGNGIAMLSNRISHFYDFQGASMTLDVGCSTSLVALHQAVQTLRSGDAIFGVFATSAQAPDFSHILVLPSSVLGPTGKCFAWDERAEGYGRGEGVASIILKPLAAALRDGDRVHAVVRETGLNQDGKTPTITSPSLDAQVKLIREVYRRAGLDPSADTGYVEAHMTGTPTGDPIEAEALARTFGAGRAESDPVLVGSVKPNIGHTEPVSGLAAILKAIFALREGVIPPNVNYENTNPNIPLKEWRLKVPRALTPWPTDKPRRASINNFGYGGTNAHIILEAPPASANHHSASEGAKTTDGVTNSTEIYKENGESHVALNGTANGITNGHTNGQTKGEDNHDRSMVYILSAKDSTGASQMNKNLASYLRSQSPLPAPIDLAFTLTERKSWFPWTTAVRASNLAELAEKLADPDRKPVRSTKVPRLGFVFNGQGAQWHAMGRELIVGYPVFRRSLLEADEILKDYGATWSLHEELLRDEKTTRVHEIRLSQPLSVALQLCLVDLLASWEIVPSAVNSHSSGEIAAAYAVGALTFRQALGVVYFRGELAQKHKGAEGAMLAAGLSAEAAAEYVKDTKDGKVVVACHNSPESVTISGDIAAVDEVATRLTENGVFARKLNVPLAYHSHHMHAMAKDYTAALQEVMVPAPEQWTNALFASPVTGGILKSPEDLTPEHFVRNLVSPVLFAEAFEQMCFGAADGSVSQQKEDSNANIDMIVEIGAHGTLAGPIRQILKNRKNFPYISLLKRQNDAVNTVQDAVCTLLAQGYPVALAGVNEHANGTFVPGLPGYAWNHGTAYWAESRLYREYRHKRFVPHELLGSPLAGTNRQTPTWRSFLRTLDIPWLADHKLGTDVVLPGAGYVAMAIEAVRLLTDPTEETIAGYRLREIEFINALTIPDTTLGVEVQMVLSPCSDKELEYKGWYNFEVWSVSGADADDSWIQHCKGGVTAETVSKSKEADTKFTLSAPLAKSFFTAGTPVREVAPDAVFAGLRAMNLFHGPIFQNLLSSRATDTKSITGMTVSPAAIPAGNTVGEQPYVLHPTTLDSLIQATFVSIPDATRQHAMAVPRSIRHLYVPRSLRREAGETITAFVDLERADRRGAMVSAVAVNGEGNDASASRLELDDLYCQAVPLDTGDLPDRQTSEICSQMRWEVDIAHGAVPAPFKAAIQQQVTFDEEDREFEKKLDRVSFNFISVAVKQLSNDSAVDSSARPPHLQRLYNWMQTVVARGQAGQLGPGSRVWGRTNAGVRQKLADDLAAENAAGQQLARMGPLLADIVRGLVETEAILKQDDLIDRYYEALPRLSQRNFAHLKKLVEQYAVAQPGAHVLEIGGRSGGATARVLEAFAAKAEEADSGDLGTLLGQYDFTDVVPHRFELVKQKCAAWTALMSFKTLDVRNDPITQGFVEESYDLILVSPGTLLRLATFGPDELSLSLKNMRRLLKPDGKLVLVETTRARLDTHLVFGGLPGWWQSESDDEGPVASVERWNELLNKTGFTGADLGIGDCDDAQFHASSVILTTATAQSQRAYPTAVSIIHTNEDTPAQEWLEQLKAGITTQTGADVAVERLSEVQAKPDVVYIFTPEMVAPFLDTMDEAAFKQLKTLVVQGQGLLWLSRSSAITSEQPVYAQSAGFLRTAKQEDTTKRYVSLDFETTTNGADGPWSATTIPQIIQVLKQSFDARVDTAEIEWEYAVKDGMLHVPRVYPSPAEDRASSETPVDPAAVEQSLWQPNRPLLWETVQTVGSLSNLYFTDDPKAAEASLPSGYVEIQSQALGLNFRDVLVALGQIDESRYMHDAAGIVTRLGPDTEASGLKVGDRVTGALEGRFATHPRSMWTGFAKMPDNMSWEEGASLPCIFLTSYLCLFDVARLQPGERVLIHAGSGGVGQSAIMLAKHAGAEVFTTCSSEEKRNLLMEQYGLDADHILSSRDPSFAAAIHERTGGAGVDVVINSLSGPLLKATWDCMARFGRFVEIGKVDMEAARRLDLTPLTRNAMIVGFDLIQWCMFNGSAVHRALQALMNLWDEKVISAVHPIVTYPIAEMETAMRRMQRGTHVGKMVLVPGPDARFKVLTRSSNLARLDDPDATYLIAGGLGGIGLALADWMMARGARHILVVSRRAESHQEAEPLVARGRAQGCNVVVRNCDITKDDQLVTLLADLENIMPPIRGVIQAAMALHDTILQKLTYEQWQSSIQPKVAGTLNLHHHLPRDLRFFVMLSSTSGVVGLVSQANYAAGNTFQDALARHRAAQGLPAVSINLPAVSDVGVVTESTDTMMRARLERTLGSPSIPIGHVLRLVEAAVATPLRAHDPNAAQVITGIVAWERITAGANPKRDRRFWTMRLSNSSSATGGGGAGTKGRSNNPDEVLKQELAGASSSDEAFALVMGALTRRLATLFNLVAADIDTSDGMSALGVDSLVAVELRNWLSGVVQAKVTVFEILQTATLREFAKLVVGRSALVV
ncbi:Lovastatin diketide synthase LovF [Cytospora mali]|uniref:Lovastatin diketide synthase LovF n=1 Tax=Cytospora mali TaxID=578113 RepID=A0A194UN76_CYTMA|nr:Lovastatin diketide synthase LovF [Valsa mali var. pyri (nom. inval.)]